MGNPYFGGSATKSGGSSRSSGGNPYFGGGSSSSKKKTTKKKGGGSLGFLPDFIEKPVDIGLDIVKKPVWNTMKEAAALPVVIPLGVAQGVRAAQKDISTISYHLAKGDLNSSTYQSELGKIGKGAVEGMKYYYTHPREIYEHPLQAILDALTIATGGGLAAAKLGRAGYLGAKGAELGKHGRLEYQITPDVKVTRVSSANPVTRNIQEWRLATLNRLTDNLPLVGDRWSEASRGLMWEKRGVGRRIGVIQEKALRPFDEATRGLTPGQSVAITLRHQGADPKSYRRELEKWVEEDTAAFKAATTSKEKRYWKKVLDGHKRMSNWLAAAEKVWNDLDTNPRLVKAQAAMKDIVEVDEELLRGSGLVSTKSLADRPYLLPRILSGARVIRNEERFANRIAQSESAQKLMANIDKVVDDPARAEAAKGMYLSMARAEARKKGGSELEQIDHAISFLDDIDTRVSEGQFLQLDELNQQQALFQKDRTPEGDVPEGEVPPPQESLFEQPEPIEAPPKETELSPERRDELRAQMASEHGKSVPDYVDAEGMAARFLDDPDFPLPDELREPGVLAERIADIFENVRAGAGGKDWYETAAGISRWIAQNDPAALKKGVTDKQIAQMIAVFSQSADTVANMAFLRKALDQWAEHNTVYAGMFPERQHKEILGILHGEPWKGRKRSSFYMNIIENLDPDEYAALMAERVKDGISTPGVHPVTVDRWVTRWFQPDKVVPGKYYDSFEKIIQAMADEIGWTPKQVQAAAWVATKQLSLAKRNPKWSIQRVIAAGEDAYNVGYDKYFQNPQGQLALGTRTVHPHADRAANLASRPDGGGTLHHTLRVDDMKAGYSASYGAFEQITPTPIRGRTIEAFRNLYLDMLKADKNLRVGIWHNPENNLVYLDITRKFRNRDEAIQFAREQGQVAYWDARAGKSVPTGLDPSEANRIKVRLRDEHFGKEKPIAAQKSKRVKMELTPKPGQEKLAAVLEDAVQKYGKVTKKGTGQINAKKKAYRALIDMSHEKVAVARLIEDALVEELGITPSEAMVYREAMRRFNETKPKDHQLHRVREEFNGTVWEYKYNSKRKKNELKKVGETEPNPRYVKLAESEMKEIRSAEFGGFFSEATQGLHAPQRKPDFEFEGRDLQKVYDTWRKYEGEFDSHIDTSIPDYRGQQIRKIKFINEALPGATVLDLLGSEGSFGKTLSEMGHKTVTLDANADMAKTFRDRGVPDGARYEVAAFGEGFMDETGKMVEAYPATEKFDVVNESMGFQFISNERAAHIAQAKQHLNPDGVLFVEEKVRTPDWKKNEAEKDAYKAQYYSKEQLKAKEERVKVGDEDSVEGMAANIVSDDDLVKALEANFKYVEPTWRSGNFVGYMATDDLAKVEDLRTYWRYDTPRDKNGPEAVAEREAQRRQIEEDEIRQRREDEMLPQAERGGKLTEQEKVVWKDERGDSWDGTITTIRPDGTATVKLDVGGTFEVPTRDLVRSQYAQRVGNDGAYRGAYTFLGDGKGEIRVAAGSGEADTWVHEAAHHLRRRIAGTSLEKNFAKAAGAVRKTGPDGKKYWVWDTKAEEKFADMMGAYMREQPGKIGDWYREQYYQRDLPDLTPGARKGFKSLVTARAYKGKDWWGGTDIEDLRAAMADAPPMYFPHAGPTIKTQRGMGVRAGSRPLGKPDFAKWNQGWRVRYSQWLPDPAMLKMHHLKVMAFMRAKELQNLAMRIGEPVDADLTLKQGYHYIVADPKGRPSKVDIENGLYDDALRGVVESTDLAKFVEENIATVDEARARQWKAEGLAIKQISDRQFKILFGDMKPVSDLVRKYDDITDIWRTLTLTYRPAWLVNNFVGQTLLYFLNHGGRGSVKAYLQAAREEMKDSEGRFTTRGGAETTLPDSLRYTGMYANEVPVSKLKLSRVGKTETRIRQGIQETNATLSDNIPRNAAYRVTLNRFAKLNDEVGELAKLVKDGKLDITDPKAKLLSDAIEEKVLTTLIDFGDLSAFERRYIRRVFPFYSWMKGIMKSTMYLGLHRPGMLLALYLLGKQGEKLGEELFGEGASVLEGFVPYDLTGAKSGRVEGLSTVGLNPYATVGQIMGGVGGGIFGSTNPIDNPATLANPFLRSVVEGVTKRQLPFGTKLSDSNLGAFLKSVGMSTPEAQLIKGLLDPQDGDKKLSPQTRANMILRYLGYPRVVKNVDTAKSIQGLQESNR